MDNELVEFVKALQSNGATVYPTAAESSCEFCSTKGKIWSVVTSFYTYEVCVCEDCRTLVAIAFPDFVSGTPIKGPTVAATAFDDTAEMWGDVTGDPAKFVSRLKIKNREFAKCLSGFLNHEVTLTDGTEHPVLASIAKQCVEDLKNPSDKQTHAFIGIYTGLLTKKRAGVPLAIETVEERASRASASRTFVELARKHKGKFVGRKTQEVLTSMIAQFDSRGSLSDKQVKYLRYIVEQLPPHLLDLES